VIAGEPFARNGRLRGMRSLPCLLIASFACATAISAEPLIVASTAIDPASGIVTVDLIATNSDAGPRQIALAPTIEAVLVRADGDSAIVRLEREPGQAANVEIAPAGFARLHYRLALPAGTRPGTLTLTLADAPAVAIAYRGNTTQVTQIAPPTTSTVSPATMPQIRPAAEKRGRSGFLPNLSTYEPIYAVYGPGTNSDARLQISLKYQFFGRPGTRTSWRDGIMFGYTQQMFWDLGRDSSPFRDVSYMPELYYALPKLASAGRWSIGGRFGLRHQSNGRSGSASRSFNNLYIEPEFETRLAGYEVAIGPRVWAYVGGRSDNPDIAHYRGNTGLFARIGTADGLQVHTSGRLNPGSGKGAAEALISYPLTRLFASGPKLYLFGQGFVGYGEDIFDYNRRQTRLRAGIGLTR
jgi:phospholipase A1